MKKFDVVVIGGGIIGLTIADSLLKNKQTNCNFRKRR